MCVPLKCNRHRFFLACIIKANNCINVWWNLCFVQMHFSEKNDEINPRRIMKCREKCPWIFGCTFIFSVSWMHFMRSKVSRHSHLMHILLETFSFDAIVVGRRLNSTWSAIDCCQRTKGNTDSHESKDTVTESIVCLSLNAFLTWFYEIVLLSFADCSRKSMLMTSFFGWNEFVFQSIGCRLFLLPQFVVFSYIRKNVHWWIHYERVTKWCEKETWFRHSCGFRVFRPFIHPCNSMLFFSKYINLWIVNEKCTSKRIFINDFCETNTTTAHFFLFLSALWKEEKTHSIRSLICYSRIRFFKREKN